MPSAPIHTSGCKRPWQTRPSADRLGNAPHVYGRLLGMDEPLPVTIAQIHALALRRQKHRLRVKEPLETPRRSFWQRVMGRGA